MFDDATLGPQILSNPSVLQNLAITEVQNRLDGIYSIADPNNGFNLLLEYSSSVFAQFTRETETKFESLYPQRATTAEDLYAFMSDYDYVNLTSSPASVQFRLILNKDWVVASAVPFDLNYNKITIPATSVFMLSGIAYGLYYPIDILVSQATGGITVLYDASTLNPLNTLSSNIPQDVSVYAQGGVNILMIAFTAYQFATSTTVETLTNITGFNKLYTYANNFYAARVFTTFDNVTWQELTYTLSQSVYDVTKPTVVMTLLEDTQTIQVTIPQIYFTNGLIGNKLKVSLLTTQGALNIAIPQVDANEMTANFDVTSSVFAAPLAQPPICQIFPYNQTTIVGGGNALTFEQLRSAVVNDTLYDQTPISPLQLTAMAKKYGYALTKYLDNITTRIFFASATLTTPDQRVVPVAVSGLILNESFLGGDPSTILSYTDGSYTILPTTVFRYDSTTNTSTPLTNAEVQWLSSLSSTNLATILNTTLYTRQPFHIVLTTQQKYPAASTYNLMTPTMTSLSFVAENVHSAAQISVTNAIIVHNNDGTGGFTISLGVMRSASLSNADPSTFKILLLTNLNGTVPVILEATYSSTTASVDVYTVFLSTNYQITLENFFQTQVTSLGTTITGSLPFVTTFDIRLCVPLTLTPNVAQNSALTQGVDASYLSSFLVVSQQIMDITFVEDMSSLLFNIVTTTWGSTPYAVYPQTVYYTQTRDVYQTDSNGLFVNRPVPGVNGAPATIQLVKLFSKGDPVLTGGNFSLVSTVDTPAGTSVLTVASTTGLLIGSPITTLGVSMGTVISALTPTTITLSTATTLDGPVGTTITVTNSTVKTVTSAAQTPTTQSQLQLASTQGIVAGMTVFGFDLPPAVTVASVSSTGITLSTPSLAIIPTGANLEFVNLQGPLSVQFQAGANKLDTTGNPIPLASRTNIYKITMAQFDARLYASQAAADIAYLTGLPKTLVTNAHAIDPIRANLLEETYVYYTPYRTIGSANYGTGGNVTQSLPLNLGFDITIYVTAAVLSDTTLTGLMQTTALSLINQAVTAPVISTQAIGTTLSQAFGTNTQSIDVSSINRIPGLDTVAVSDTGVQPSINYILKTQADGTLAIMPDVNIKFILAPT